MELRKNLVISEKHKRLNASFKHHRGAREGYNAAVLLYPLGDGTGGLRCTCLFLLGVADGSLKDKSSSGHQKHRRQHEPRSSQQLVVVRGVACLIHARRYETANTHRQINVVINTEEN